jgi:hypothetical protein
MRWLVVDEPDTHDQGQAPGIGGPQQVAEFAACQGPFGRRRVWGRQLAGGAGASSPT